MNLRKLIYLTGIVSLVSSCKKEKNADTGIYIINNTVPRNVNVRIYPTLNDYNHNTNAILSTSIAANASTNVPMSNFDATKTYYIDYYTDDYSISNWLERNQNPALNYTILLHPKANAAFNIENPADNSSLIRKAYLNGDGTETHWSTFEICKYDIATARYVPVQGVDKQAQLVLRKDFTATFSRAGYDTSYRFEPYNDDKVIKGFLRSISKNNLLGFVFSGALGADSLLMPKMSLDTLAFVLDYDTTGYCYRMAKVK